jgi:tetratricopeptide (TPR) repeat protein
LCRGHIFIKYKEDGKSSINVETTSFGTEFYGYYAQQGIDMLDKDKTIYGKPLSKYQLLSVFMYNIAGVLADKGEYHKSEVLLRKCLEIMPNDPGAMLNLGLLLAAQDKKDEAENLFVQALKLNPYNMNAVLLAGCYFAYEKKREHAEAF